MSPARSVKRTKVFLNLPFDAQHEKIYLALIAGLSALGLTPRCVLEIQPTSARLTRLLRLISSCEYSIHDLSRVQLSPTAPRCPRFNMPFEIGDDCGLGRDFPTGGTSRIVTVTSLPSGSGISSSSFKVARLTLARTVLPIREMAIESDL